MGWAAAWLLAACASLQDQLTTPNPYIADLLARGAYDEQLCATAVMLINNATSDDFAIEVIRAAGDRFNTEQMATDTDTRTVTVASLIQSVEVDGGELHAAVSCKMIHRDRINDQFNMQLPGPNRECRYVNEFTHQVSLDSLTDKERRAYEENGRALVFRGDFVTGAGAQWLPTVINDFIDPMAAGGFAIRSPSVQVPWDYDERDWYQGVQSCKLITLAAMRRWMTTAALWPGAELFPRVTPVCTEPSARTARAGSCILYFGPAGATFCQDFSGAGWTPETAAADCGKRYATRAQWDAADGSYVGDGGVYSPMSCAERDAPAELRAERFAIAEPVNRGTCVWRCNDADETLWHSMTAVEQVDGRSLRDNCELFLDPYW